MLTAPLAHIWYLEEMLCSHNPMAWIYRLPKKYSHFSVTILKTLHTENILNIVSVFWLFMIFMREGAANG